MDTKETALWEGCLVIEISDNKDMLSLEWTIGLYKSNIIRGAAILKDKPWLKYFH